MRNNIVKRQEIKYIIDYKESFIIKNKLKYFLKSDIYNETTNYTVTSIYFDDIYNHAIKEKLEGNEIRFKYRIRFYNDNLNIIKFEKKVKLDQITVKHTALITKEEATKLLNNDYEFCKDKEESIFTEFYFYTKAHIIKPKIQISYNRTAFLHPLGNLRITFDSFIQTSSIITLDKEKTIYEPVLNKDDVVLEIKFNHVYPNFIKQIIESYKHIPTSMSKYTKSRWINYY